MINMFQITKEELEQTIKKPDRVMDCKIDGLCCYIKKFRGKAELLVITEQVEGVDYSVKCFGWIQNMVYPS